MSYGQSTLLLWAGEDGKEALRDYRQPTYIEGIMTMTTTCGALTMSNMVI